PSQADLLGAENFVAHEGVAGEGVEPLRVERLVERQLQVARLVVQGDVAVIRPGQVHDGDLSHPEVALHAIVAHGGFDLVQERVLERPQVRVWDRHLDRHLVGAARQAPRDGRQRGVLETQRYGEVPWGLFEERGRDEHPLPVHAAGTVIVRAYQPIGALSGTPESGLPQGNGTTIGRGAGRPVRGQPWDSPTSGASNWNCHGPFRFCHSARWKSGRGCSARGICRGSRGEDLTGTDGTSAAPTTASVANEMCFSTVSRRAHALAWESSRRAVHRSPRSRHGHCPDG